MQQHDQDQRGGPFANRMLGQRLKQEDVSCSTVPCFVFQELAQLINNNQDPPPVCAGDAFLELRHQCNYFRNTESRARYGVAKLFDDFWIPTPAPTEECLSRRQHRTNQSLREGFRTTSESDAAETAAAPLIAEKYGVKLRICN